MPSSSLPAPQVLAAEDGALEPTSTPNLGEIATTLIHERVRADQTLERERGQEPRAVIVAAGPKSLAYHLTHNGDIRSFPVRTRCHRGLLFVREPGRTCL